MVVARDAPPTQTLHLMYTRSQSQSVALRFARTDRVCYTLCTGPAGPVQVLHTVLWVPLQVRASYWLMPHTEQFMHAMSALLYTVHDPALIVLQIHSFGMLCRWIFFDPLHLLISKIPSSQWHRMDGGITCLAYRY